MIQRVPEGQPPSTFRSLVLSVYLPSLFFSVGQGAVVPIMPLLAVELGGSAAVAAMVVAVRGLGTLAFDVPSGLVVSRFGDKGAMIAGTLLVTMTAVGISANSSVAWLGLLSFIMGGGWAFWFVARQAYISEVVPVGHRGRALTYLAAVHRTGNFVGPILGGFVGKYFSLHGVFFAQAAMGLAATALVVTVIRHSIGSEQLGVRGLRRRLVRTAVEYRRIFLYAGYSMMCLQFLREGRQLFFPLWGRTIGLDVAEIGLVFGVVSFLEAALFHPAGYVMDHWGRKWTGVPCLALHALGLLLLPLTGGMVGFVLVALVIGIGNGMGTGILLTLGADFAPADRRGEFLGVWRLAADAGSAAGPMVASFFVGLAGLAAASAACGGIGFSGALVMAFLMPETLPRRRVESAKRTP
jgi:MFS family permease